MKTTRHHHGAALTETVLVLPVILLILSLLIFFGLSMVRLQRASVMDRYEAWRTIASADGPSDNEQLNQSFFAGNATNINQHATHVDFTDAQDIWINETRAINDDAVEWLTTMFDDLPRVRRIGFSTTHDITVPLWERFSGPITHHHVVIDGDWRYAVGTSFDASQNKWVASGPIVDYWPALRDTFLEEIDETLEPSADNGNMLTQTLRNLYLNSPGYVGPYLGDW